MTIDINKILTVSKESGILPPVGEKYIPNSIEEFNKIKNKITGYLYTSEGVKISFPISTETNIDGVDYISKKRRYYTFISIFMLGETYYIDLDTVEMDIRNKKINNLLQAS